MWLSSTVELDGQFPESQITEWVEDRFDAFNVKLKSVRVAQSGTFTVVTLESQVHMPQNRSNPKDFFDTIKEIADEADAILANLLDSHPSAKSVW